LISSSPRRSKTQASKRGREMPRFYADDRANGWALDRFRSEVIAFDPITFA
jgi:hypothetical protein